MKERRIQQVDLAKAYGIIAIICWHLKLGILHESKFLSFFVLPLFFYLSGLFAKNEHLKWSFFLQRELKRLLIPLFFLSLFYIIVYLTFSCIFPSIYSSKEMLYRLINPFHTVNGPLWFLWALFFIDCIHNTLTTLKHQSINIAIAILLFFIGFNLRQIHLGGHELRLPFMIDVAMTSYIFFYIGSKTRNFIKSWMINKKWVLITIIYCVLSYLFPYSNGSFFGNGYEAPWLIFLLMSFYGILWIMGLLNNLSKYVQLNFIGRNTLPLLGLHYSFIPLCNSFENSIHTNILIEYSFIILFILFICCLTYLYIHYVKPLENIVYHTIINHNNR